MYPRSFGYACPSSLRQAVELLDRYRDNAKVLAGGHSLVPLLKLRLTSPRYLVDITRIRELDYIRELKGSLCIGALSTHHTIETSRLIAKRSRLMVETASLIGDPQVRNVGTIGGALAHADPAGDWGATMLALRVELKAKGPRGERRIKADQFFVDTFTTALRRNEILTEICIPFPALAAAGAYLKLERKLGDFATVGVAVQLNVRAGRLVDVGIGLTAVGPTPLRAARAESCLHGKRADESVIEEAASATSTDSKPTSDIRGSAEYKRAMVRELTKRAIKLALQRVKAR